MYQQQINCLWLMHSLSGRMVVQGVLSWEYTRGRGEPRRGTASSECLLALCLLLKSVFQFQQSAACSVHIAHEEGNFLDLPHFDLPTTNGSDAAASEACGSVRCTICTSRGEAATLCLGLPLPQVYSQLYLSNETSEEAFYVATLGI